MADTKITGLTADASPAQDALIVTVKDPGGVPLNRKVTLADLANKIHPTTTFAGLPAAAWSGRLAFPSNGVWLARDSGAALVPWGPIFPLADPALQTFAWINQGTATIDSTNGGVYLEAPSNGGAYSWAIRKKAAPATPYVITVAFAISFDVSQTTLPFPMAGLCFRESASGKLVIFHGAVSNDGGAPAVPQSYFRLSKFTDPATFSALYFNNPAPLESARLWFMRIKDDGVNRTTWYSADGQHFIQVNAIGRTDFLTADEVGFAVNGYGAKTGMTLYSWAEG